MVCCMLYSVDVSYPNDVLFALLTAEDSPITPINQPQVADEGLPGRSYSVCW